jgi:hypothetical protein
MIGVAEKPELDQLRVALLALAAGIEKVAGTLDGSGKVSVTTSAILDLRVPLTEVAFRLERTMDRSR